MGSETLGLFFKAFYTQAHKQITLKKNAETHVFSHLQRFPPPIPSFEPLAMQ